MAISAKDNRLKSASQWRILPTDFPKRYIKAGSKPARSKLYGKGNRVNIICAGGTLMRGLLNPAIYDGVKDTPVQTGWQIFAALHNQGKPEAGSQEYTLKKKGLHK